MGANSQSVDTWMTLHFKIRLEARCQPVSQFGVGFFQAYAGQHVSTETRIGRRMLVGTPREKDRDPQTTRMGPLLASDGDVSNHIRVYDENWPDDDQADDGDWLSYSGAHKRKWASKRAIVAGDAALLKFGSVPVVETQQLFLPRAREGTVSCVQKRFVRITADNTVMGRCWRIALEESAKRGNLACSRRSRAASPGTWRNVLPQRMKRRLAT